MGEVGHQYPSPAVRQQEPSSDVFGLEKICDFAKEIDMPFLTAAERFGCREAAKHLLAVIEAVLGYRAPGSSWKASLPVHRLGSTAASTL